MGAKGSKPQNLPVVKSNNKPRNNTRKNVSNTNRRNQTRVNKQASPAPTPTAPTPICGPPIWPTYPYGMPHVDCKKCPPPDPEKKTPRTKVPGSCLEKWEQEIFLQESNRKHQARIAAPKPPIPLNLPTITWERLQEAAETTSIDYPILFFQTPNTEEYAIVNCESIEELTSNGKETFPLLRFFNANKEQLIGFCNYVYDPEIIDKHLEEGIEPYLILHRLSNELIEVVGFMTIVFYYGGGVYIGDFCVGPKRGGIGRHALERVKTLAKTRELEYVELEPASNTEPFYEKLGFRENPKYKRHHIWFVKNGGRRLNMPPK